MNQQHRYRANIVNAYRTTHYVYLSLIGLSTILTTFALIGSFRYYQQRTAMTYIFHPQGAALPIYDAHKSHPVVPVQHLTP